MVGPIRPQFVLFGSSIVQLSFGNGGWGAILADLYSRQKLDNLPMTTTQLRDFLLVGLKNDMADIFVRGYAGWNSRHGLQVLEQVFPKDDTVQPSVVIVYFGGNDSMLPDPLGFSPHIPLPEYVENLRKIAMHLKSLSEKTRIIFLGAPPLNEEQMNEAFRGIMRENSRTNKLCQMYSDACVKLCREMDIKVVDLFASMQKRKDWSAVCFTDGIHFSAEGSKIVVDEIRNILEEADWEPSLQCKSMAIEFEEICIANSIASSTEITEAN